MLPEEKVYVNLILQADLLHKANLYAKVTLNPSCGIGYHVHHNEGEVIYILEGEATYNDGGSFFRVSKGDVLVCPPEQGHAITNNSISTVEIMALIIKE